jgi:hypothetical protein
MSETDPTIEYYNQHAAEFARRTMSRTLDEIYPIFLGRLKPGAHILDAGCGPGRDARVSSTAGTTSPRSTPQNRSRTWPSSSRDIACA